MWHRPLMLDERSYPLSGRRHRILGNTGRAAPCRCGPCAARGACVRGSLSYPAEEILADESEEDGCRYHRCQM